MHHLIKIAIVSLSLGTLLLVPTVSFAADPVIDYKTGLPKEGYELFFGNGTKTDAEVNALLPKGAKTDPRTLITNLLGIIAGFLGIIAVVIILISGFQWMTAGGDEEAVKTAQKRLVQGVIGLILILSTWSVAYYVVNTLSGTIFK